MPASDGSTLDRELLVRAPDRLARDIGDPHDRLDEEARRIEVHLAGLPEPGWSAPTRCAGWTVRDLLAHLDAAEEYHRACLDHRLGRFLTAYIERGATDRESLNAIGVADRAQVPPPELLARWQSSNAQTRRRLRARDGGELPTAVGSYPVRLQALHLANELAVHADDLGVPVTPGEAEHRLRWRAAASRLFLRETELDLEVEAVDGGTCVCVGTVRVVLSDAELVEAVAGRADDSSLDPLVRCALDVRA